MEEKQKELETELQLLALTRSKTAAIVDKGNLDKIPGAPNDNFRKIICSEDDLRSRIFGSFFVRFVACLPLLGFSNI